MDSAEPNNGEGDLAVVPLSIHFVMFGLGIVALLNMPTERAQMVDLLITIITVSGITASVAVAYLSLGRNADVLSEIVDALPYLMKVNQATISALRTVALNNVGKPGTPTAEEIDAITELSQSSGAPVSIMPHDIKIKLIPRSVRQIYFRYFARGRDQRIAKNMVWLAGIPGVLCLFALFISYYDAPNITVGSAENTFVVFGALTNLVAFSFFALLSRARSNIQEKTRERVSFICRSAHEAPGRAEEESRKSEYTEIELTNFLGKLASSPRTP